ncbi:TetR/AcrR family transcriptional regulator [uncultured Brevundimonas sp.]|uniref:TetR/AcrR family transcriptional regulator n=1 Tax=uncultured Brevundimonas sp. TaxID=213418 RepID=UPI0030EEA766|tara:strand:- start:45258 stop:45932 length:675 start_codon:yes stop_codon:yes gene_type:complete
MAKRGRPSTFDREEALQRAMELFWARGYEGVTLEDLQVAMGGITPPSLYHAFGSKERLFLKAADLYLATIGDPTLRALEEGKTAREAVEAMLRLTAESFSAPGKPHGCLLVLGATNCAPSNKGPQDYLRAIRQRAPEVIEQRLKRAVAEGDLPPELDTAAVAAFYATVIHGLGVRAGDGASREALLSAVDGAMAAWDVLATTANTDPRSATRPATVTATGPRRG